MSLSGIPQDVRNQLKMHLTAEAFFAQSVQLITSCNLEDSNDVSLLFPLKSAVAVVPIHISQVTSGLGNINTKMGKMKVR